MVQDSYPLDFSLSGNAIAFDGTRGRVHFLEVENDVSQIITVDLA